MVNYACGFYQSETGKYFARIIIINMFTHTAPTLHLNMISCHSENEQESEWVGNIPGCNFISNPRPLGYGGGVDISVPGYTLYCTEVLQARV